MFQVIRFQFIILRNLTFAEIRHAFAIVERFGTRKVNGSIVILPHLSVYQSRLIAADKVTLSVVVSSQSNLVSMDKRCPNGLGNFSQRIPVGAMDEICP